VRYDKPECPVVPYAGAGVGGDASAIDLDNVRAGAFVVDGSAAEVVFAWQAFAGARYRINENMPIGAGYKFFSAEGASYDVRRTFADIKLGKACVHSAVVDFTWKF
jgi:opacity protein-like surface antigen